jgi:uncharacterized protein
MKSFVLVLFTLLLATTARADDASKAAKIEEMLKLTHVDQLMEQMMAQMQPMMEAQFKKIGLPDDARPAMEEFQKRMTEWMTGKMGYDKLKPIYVKIYAETLTEEEIDGAIAYYRTPAGQSLLKKMPLLMQKSMTYVQDMMGDVIPEMAKIGEDIEKKYKKK